MTLLFENDKFKFRTRERMVEDVYNAFKSQEISNGAKLSVLNDVLWQYTQYFGKDKYLDCPYWSIEAVNKYNHLVKKNEKITFGKYFTHEHVVPRNIIRSRIIYQYQNNLLSIDTLQSIFEKCVIGVIITVEEDMVLRRNGLRDNMPPYLNNNVEDYTVYDVWSRYNKLKKFLNFKINVYKVECYKNEGKSLLKPISFVN